MKNCNNIDKDLVFDKDTSNFIVTVRMTPEEYGRMAHEQVIVDLNKMVFDKENGQFVGPVFMSPEEYSNYAKDKRLPYR